MFLRYFQVLTVLCNCSDVTWLHVLHSSLWAILNANMMHLLLWPLSTLLTPVLAVDDANANSNTNDDVSSPELIAHLHLAVVGWDVTPNCTCLRPCSLTFLGAKLTEQLTTRVWKALLVGNMWTWVICCSGTCSIWLWTTGMPFRPAAINYIILPRVHYGKKSFA